MNTQTTDAPTEAAYYPFTGHPADSPITFHTPTIDALRHIAEHMCPADRAELAATGQHDPLASLMKSVETSRESFVAEWNGEPQAALGVADLPQDHRFGVPWMLSTGNGSQHAREFMAASRSIVEAWAPMYLALANVVSREHHVARRWLRALGFAPLAEHTINGHLFEEFARFSHV
ncbi:hypothetical protein ASG87_00645 [Frateuria sp. Soil773]|uniref:hypothetical protein n=1 Tax=Frateuria sp. Soil773 TaxID=1736407 RepID=UPI0006F94CD0|nr:hypothetical protein [Frateuria sp. Soil773]KRE92460.1 hypothetical protein ASG87_00645 [Frateuria sp. Soil773]